MKNYLNYKNLLLAAVATGTMASCSTEEAVITSSQDVTERIDMVLQGNDSEYIFKQSEQEDLSEDLVDYNFYGSPSHQVDFKVNLDENRTLIFRIMNETIWNPWESEEGYSIYSTDELDDKQKYVTVEMENGGEVPSYMSNIGNYPQGTYLNVFQIEDYDPANNEILCRIVDLPIVSTTGQNGETLTINGTFRGSITATDQ